MAKKNKHMVFQPFTHDDLEIKNELLNLARQSRLDNSERKLEYNLASVLIYSSIAEYIAENLLQNLTHFVKIGTYNNFAGILFIEKISKKEAKMTLGELITEINKFSFPDKKDIMECFNKVCTARNRLFHDFAKSDLEEIVGMISKDLPIIQDKCEELINKINTIYAGLAKILINTQDESK